MRQASLQDYTYTIGKLVSLTPAQFCRSAQFHQRQRHVGNLKQDLLPVPMIYEADELVELNNPAGVRGTEVLVKRLSWDRLTLEPEILMSCIADILNGLEARYELVESKDDNGAQFAAHVRMDDLAFRIMVTDDTEPGFFRIACTRLRGDTFAFHDAYRKIRASLGDTEMSSWRKRPPYLARTESGEFVSFLPFE